MRCIVIVLFSLFTFLPGVAQNFSVKGLYVNQFASILGNTQAEDSLLQYALGNGYTYLALYELHVVQQQHDLTDFVASAPLAAFINKAKTQYYIEQVGAIAENYWFFENRIHPYNQLHPNTNEQFDVFNLEFEFWITAATGPNGYYCTTYLQPDGYACDTAGAFDFYINELRKIDSLAATEGHISETYVGWPTEGQCHEINATCDRVLLHAYVTAMNQAYGYTQTRLSYFGTSADSAHIIVLFSAEPAFMGPWLVTTPEYGTWPQYNWDYTTETASWINNINLIGYQWFAYTYMPYEMFTTVNDVASQDQYYTAYDDNDLLISSSISTERTYTLYNAAGAHISTQTSTSSTVRMNMNTLATGLYVLSITDHSTGAIYSRKLLFTHQ